ncbi:PepSY domain-containing protein [Streptomyces sporangiiformans]|uniref:Uncharacterized protein n=1 Tax=Streptomyces sporangiiformans TaxID=2315329 RepID=A0A505CZ05_9ACTN|nr:PepSY domain-containing protein [Streptomyces sporangiiformans]TPQ15667.1 hypothetical protein FGD71_046090 [Streptomyces sporangiiformans]
MKHRGKWIVAAALSAALVGAGTGIAVATGGGDDDGEQPITGAALEKASAAALAHTDGGKVTGTEVGDEEGYYEVEVTLGDGKQTDVHLNKDFKVLGSIADHEGENGE